MAANDHLPELGIEPQRAAAAVSFLEGYGRLCEAELAEMEPGSETFWRTATDGASAYREASQWAAILEDPRLPGLMAKAATLYTATGQAFGWFLSVAGRRWRTSPEAPVQREHLEQLATALGLAQFEVSVPSPLRHPQQQAYAFLALAGWDGLELSHDFVLDRIAADPSGRLGTAPVGALGVPLRDYWAMGAALLGRDRDGVRTVARTLAAMGNRYAVSVELARVNSYLWRNAAAPVDVVDMDMLAISMIAADSYGRGRLREAVASEQDRREMSPLARTPLDVAVQVATGGSGKAGVS
ncbi:hypothetical protein ACIB24_12485 [Spongisporangium articulatum]|uniref:Uncharacterized protein n=1 Tax=Spongisporangium articulatum TaxID=3362603 RepID=A0ABW8AQG1_9ACTN